MTELAKRLRQYGDSEMYPFHMPGHKRRALLDENPYRIDITEIDGFDNLHHAEGILRSAQERAADLYGSSETHYLVNGSTAGILSAVSACALNCLLVARNSHRAVYHAALIRDLTLYYVSPSFQERFALNGGISPAEVERQLLAHPEIEAVFVTSPTYDGVVSDIRAIAAAAHRHGKPLIVDEAHGAHFGFSPYFPQNSVRLGADIVIHSLHKTLPAFTQSALLHVNGRLVDRERLRAFLAMYQTSSPSYVLMAGMDACVRYVREEGEAAFAAFAERLEGMYRTGKDFTKIRLVDTSVVGRDEICDFDRSKLIFSVKDCGMTGLELQERLRRDYRLELEMAAGTYALALTSCVTPTKGLRGFPMPCERSIKTSLGAGKRTRKIG